MRHKGIMGIILGICLTGLLLAGCGMPQGTPQKDERPVIKLGSDRYPPFNYFNEDGVPTGIDVDLATEAFGRMGYRVEVHNIDWEKKNDLLKSGELDCIMGCFSMEGRLDDYRWAGPYMVSRQVVAVNPESDTFTTCRILLEKHWRYSPPRSRKASSFEGLILAFLSWRIFSA